MRYVVPFGRHREAVSRLQRRGSASIAGHRARNDKPEATILIGTVADASRRRTGRFRSSQPPRWIISGKSSPAVYRAADVVGQQARRRGFKASSPQSRRRGTRSSRIRVEYVQALTQCSLPPRGW